MQDIQLQSFWMTPKEIVQNLDIDDIMKFLEELDAQPKKRDNTIVARTICHNFLGEEASHKLYYYHDTKTFHCYTQCGDSFSIFELYKRYHELNYGEELNFNDVLAYIKMYIDVEVIIQEDKKSNPPISKLKEKYDKKNLLVELPEFPHYLPDIFSEYYHPEWLNEGISSQTMDDFNIRFFFRDNRIIIPHRDLNGRLVGIRIRAFEEEDIKKGKYRPLYFGETSYKHQLGFSLYGIFEHKKAIQKMRRAIIYEGEKSVLLDHTYNGDNSVAVACCGNALNKYQIRLLTHVLGACEITIAFDREYEKIGDDKYKKQITKLSKLAKKYSMYARMSYIIDNNNLLEYKSSPIDYGIETLNKLYDKRIKV